MKSLLGLIAVTLLTSSAFAQQNQCKVLVEIYDEHSRDAAVKIAKEVASKTNSNGYVVNVIAAELKKCQEKNVRERWTKFSPKYSRCHPLTYVHTKPQIMGAIGTKKECSAIATKALVSKGFNSQDVGIRQSDKLNTYALKIVLPPYTFIQQ